MDDMISRQAAIEFIKDHSYPVRYDETSIEQGMTLTGIEQALNEVPTIQSQQKTGYWFDVGSLSCRCSECGGKSNRESRYCPNCGAKNGDGGVDMDRHLDGIYLRIERNGKFQAVCLSDMTREELEANLDPSRGEWLKGAVIHLARTLSDIGKMLDLEAKIDDE